MKLDSFTSELHRCNPVPTAVKVGLHLWAVAVLDGETCRAHRSREKLAEECNLAPMTVRKALAVLASVGLVREGHGYVDLIVG